MSASALGSPKWASVLYWKENTEKTKHILSRSSKNKEGRDRLGCWRLENEVRVGVRSVLEGRGGNLKGKAGMGIGCGSADFRWKKKSPPPKIKRSAQIGM